MNPGLITCSSQRRGRDVPSWLWLGLPALTLLIQHIVLFTDRELYQRVFESERGIVELVTPLIAIIAAAFGLLALKGSPALPARWLKVWILLGALGAFYFAGEELSWGQQLWHWTTPEYWQGVNDQRETNLHNVSSWLDQKPRLLLQIGILIGGIIYPLTVGRRTRADAARHWRSWVWPTYVVLPAAFIATTIHLLDHTGAFQAIGGAFAIVRYSETEELYYALFLLLYLASIRYRLRSLSTRTVNTGELTRA